MACGCKVPNGMKRLRKNPGYRGGGRRRWQFIALYPDGTGWRSSVTASSHKGAVEAARKKTRTEDPQNKRRHVQITVWPGLD